MRETGRIAFIYNLFLCFLLAIGDFFDRLLADFEVVQVETGSRSFLGDQESRLFGIGWTYFLTNEDVGERTVVIEQPTLSSTVQEQLVVEFTGYCRGVLYLWENVTG